MSRSISCACLIASLLTFALPGSVEANATRTALAPILTKVEFRETPVHDAIEYLRTRSRELDPAGVGVNFVIDPAIDPETTVTLRLSHFVGSGHPDTSKRTNALNNVYKWSGGKWTFVRYRSGEEGLRSGSMNSSPD